MFIHLIHFLIILLRPIRITWNIGLKKMIARVYACVQSTVYNCTDGHKHHNKGGFVQRPSRTISLDVSDPLPCIFYIHRYRATTSFGYCSSMVSHPVRPLCANARRIRCQADLNSFPLGELEETIGTPPYYVDEDYPAGPEINEPLPERSNWRGSESPTLEIDVYVWCYALIVVHARR